MAETAAAANSRPQAQSEPEHDERITTHDAEEDTPLLSREEDRDEEQAQQPVRQDSERSSATSSLLRAIQGNRSGKSHARRWPSYLALVVLIAVGVLILVGGFFAPEIAQEYAAQAVNFDPTRLSVDSFSETGVNARIQGDFIVDASRVQRKPVRDLGRFGSWIVAQAATRHTLVGVTLPEYGDMLLGTADLPPIKVDLRDGSVTKIDLITHVEPGDKDAFRRLANDWVEGSLGDLHVKGEATVSIDSGLFQFGGHYFEHSLVLSHDKIPDVPEYTIKTLNFTEVDLPSGGSGLKADVTIAVANPYPVDFVVPPLGFAILVDGCTPSDPHIMVADAKTHSIRIEPKEDVDVSVAGFIQRLPDTLLAECPGSSSSPFDNLLAKYLHGDAATAYVQGSDSPSSNTPAWISELIHGVTVPVSIPGHPMKNLIKKFSMKDVEFSLPDFFGEPGTPAAQPKISAKIDAIIALPEEMNFDIDVNRIRSNATVFYKEGKLGNLDLQKWHPAQSHKVTLPKQHHADLEVISAVERVPLFITNQTLFEDVVGAIISGDNLNLTVQADVDVEVTTALGQFIAHRIPAKGSVPIKPTGDNNNGTLPDFRSVKPKVGDLRIVSTTEDSLTIGALVNFTNPTKYTADVPYFDINIWINQTVVGHATVKDVYVKKGKNINVPMTAVWAPGQENGTSGRAVGQEALSQYLSGYNLTLTIQAHRGSVPAQPELGLALSAFNVSLPAPPLGGSKPPGDGPGDGDDDDEKHRFIKDSTFHIFSSTANFVLDSPLKRTLITLRNLDANAFYKGDAVGTIAYEEPLEVPPGESETPRLPVAWDLNSLGYEAIRNALGGTLKLSAFARVDVVIGRWRERLWYRGRSIGVRIRI